MDTDCLPNRGLLLYNNIPSSIGAPRAFPTVSPTARLSGDSVLVTIALSSGGLKRRAGRGQSLDQGNSHARSSPVSVETRAGHLCERPLCWAK